MILKNVTIVLSETKLFGKLKKGQKFIYKNQEYTKIDDYNAVSEWPYDRTRMWMFNDGIRVEVPYIYNAAKVKMFKM